MNDISELAGILERKKEYKEDQETHSVLSHLTWKSISSNSSLIVPI